MTCTISDGIRIGAPTPADNAVTVPPGNIVVAGLKNSGKTTFLRRLIAGRARCDDAITWVISPSNDPTLAGPWLRDHARTGGPARVDWYACRTNEIKTMLDAATKIAGCRRAAALAEMVRTDSARLHPSPSRPDLTVVVDDVDLLNDVDLRVIRHLIRYGDAVGVHVALAAPALTADLIPSDAFPSVSTIVFTSPPGRAAHIDREVANMKVQPRTSVMVVSNEDMWGQRATVVDVRRMRAADVERQLRDTAGQPAAVLPDAEVRRLDAYRIRFMNGDTAELENVLRSAFPPEQ